MEKTMYPKVKVRGQDDQDDFKGSSSPWLLLNDDSCFPVKEHEDISPPHVAKVPKSYVPNVLIPTISVSEGLTALAISISEGAQKTDNKFDEDDKINIRASPILRPRAVVSSPDNDVMIGNKNRLTAKRPSPLKNHNLVQNRHAQCKVVSSNITESPIKTRNSKDADGTKSDLRGKKGSVIAGPSQKRFLKTGKPNSANKC